MRGIKRLLGALVALVVIVAGCQAPGAGTEPGSGADGATDTEQLYATRAVILQAPGGEPQLCLGAIAASHPPQCGGPRVVGLDWDELEGVASASGTTWWDGWVTGTYDGETFTLATASADAPDGVEEPSPDSVTSDFPALCEDPYRGGVQGYETTDRSAHADFGDLQTAAAALEGYITLYVSDGQLQANVLVTGDPEPAHAALREVWQGWLCVAQGSGADAAAIASAQNAVFETSLGGSILFAGSGVDGVLDVEVVLADADTLEVIHEAVSPWLAPDQVRVSGRLIEIDR